MKNFDSRVYSVADILEWSSHGLLELSPEFQRRSVWTPSAKSYLIDTILQGKPFPKILVTQTLKANRQVRTVIDGQQRLRAILEFYDNSFVISKAHNKTLAGYTYYDLDDDQKDDFLKYEIAIDLLFDLSYEETLDIFTRLNTYTVTLNKFEHFNASYLGYFKQSVFGLGRQYARLFIDCGVMKNSNVNRMQDAELAADLLASIVDRVQSNKTIETLFKKYEDDDSGIDDAIDKFKSVMDVIFSIYSPNDLSETNWRRIQLFYTLFTALANILFGVEGLKPINRRKFFNKKDISTLRVILDGVSEAFDDMLVFKSNSRHYDEYRDFIEYSQRATTDTDKRVYRSNFLVDKLQ